MFCQVEAGIFKVVWAGLWLVPVAPSFSCKSTSPLAVATASKMLKSPPSRFTGLDWPSLLARRATGRETELWAVAPEAAAPEIWAAWATPAGPLTELVTEAPASGVMKPHSATVVSAAIRRSQGSLRRCGVESEKRPRPAATRITEGEELVAPWVGTEEGPAACNHANMAVFLVDIDYHYPLSVATLFSPHKRAAPQQSARPTSATPRTTNETPGTTNETAGDR